MTTRKKRTDRSRQIKNPYVFYDMKNKAEHTDRFVF